MGDGNKTILHFFILKGISDIPGLQAPIFIVILFIYLITICGNTTILLLVCIDPQLHTPMYFFIVNLSLMDMFSITASLHKVLNSFITGDNTISFHACMAQMYIYSSMTGADMFILTVMSYDRYVAICNPLHYPMVMRNTVCVILVFFSWFLSFLQNAIPLFLWSRISCYRSHVVDHYFCDVLPLMELSCKENSALVSFLVIEGTPIALILFSLTLMPYIFLINTILKIRSSTGRHKAFYTCSSHLTVVSLFYVSIFFVYMSPNTMSRLSFKKISSLFNTALDPLLNPLIYSLKNKDMKSALKQQLLHGQTTMKLDNNNILNEVRTQWSTIIEAPSPIFYRP